MAIQTHHLRQSGSTLALILTSALLASPLAAQEMAASDATALPEIVVDGATLEAKSAKKKSGGALTESTSSDAAQSASPSSSDSSGGAGEAAGTAQPAESAPPVTAESDDIAGGIEARKLATPISVITGAELRARQIRNAADALRSMPGVHVGSSGGGGQLTQVRLRGAEGNHTLVIIDGVEANDTNSGEFDFSNLSADDIERIEVIRGVQSGLYGSRAIGGVINIVTRGGKGPLTFRGRVEGGSFGTRDVTGGVSAGNERGYFAGSVSYRETDGFNIAPEGDEEDGFRRSGFNIRSGVSIVEGISIDFNLRRTATLADYDSFTGPVGMRQTAVDSANESDAVVWLGGGKLTWDTLGGALTHVVGYNFNDSTFSSYDRADAGIFDDATYDNHRDRYYYLATARFGLDGIGLRNTVSGLAEKENETFTPSAFFTDNLERERERVAYAAEYRGELFDRIFPIASIRHEDNDSFEDFTTWKTGVSVDVKEIGIRPHASVGTAVALPGMFEQYGSILGTFVGNPDLTPEESVSWDAGVEFSVIAGRATIDVTYFEANLENEIVGFGNTLVNLEGESERRGIEVAGRALVTTDVTVGAAYTWLNSEDSSGLAEIRRPEHAARFDVNYVFLEGRGTLNVAAIYNGETPDLAFLNLPPPVFFGSEFVTLDSYWLVNVAASYQLAPGVEIYGRVENALKEDYQEVFGYETADLAAYAGVRFTYEEPATRAWAAGGGR
ncbi:MAG: TonB-dependent receptor [Hyphomicrobium sp.]|nr:TonB-dependent receptor [Hyphomicrobium sp.]